MTDISSDSPARIETRHRARSSVDVPRPVDAVFARDTTRRTPGGRSASHANLGSRSAYAARHASPAASVCCGSIRCVSRSSAFCLDRFGGFATAAAGDCWNGTPGTLISPTAPTESQVKRGPRSVRGGETELIEKLGGNDLCPCGSTRRFKNCCRLSGRFRRRDGRPLLPGALAAPACLRSSDGRAAGFDPARRGSNPLGGSGTVAEQERRAPAKRDTAVRVRPVSCRKDNRVDIAGNVEQRSRHEVLDACSPARVRRDGGPRRARSVRR